MSLRIAAVATAYHPDDRLTAVVESALESCSTVIVVDNTPGTEPTVADKLAGLGTGADGSGRVKVLRSGANLGLAAALLLSVLQLATERRTFGQVVGALQLENAIARVELAGEHELPLAVQLGVTGVLLLTVLTFGAFVRHLRAESAEAVGSAPGSTP